MYHLHARVFEVVALLQEVGAGQARQVVAAPLFVPVRSADRLFELPFHIKQQVGQARGGFFAAAAELATVHELTAAAHGPAQAAACDDSGQRCGELQPRGFAGLELCMRGVFPQSQHGLVQGVDEPQAKALCRQ